jgi:hypothetical protein
MSEYLRGRINRKLDNLSEERLYQVLDYVEFLEARYAEKQAAQANVFQRFAEGVEDKLRAGGVAASTVAETMGFLGKAMNVLNGVAQSTVNVANDVVTKARNVADVVVPGTNVENAAGSGGGTQTAPAPTNPAAASAAQQQSPPSSKGAEGVNSRENGS